MFSVCIILLLSLLIWRQYFGNNLLTLGNFLLIFQLGYCFITFPFVILLTILSFVSWKHLWYSHTCVFFIADSLHTLASTMSLISIFETNYKKLIFFMLFSGMLWKHSAVLCCKRNKNIQTRQIVTSCLNIWQYTY